MTRRGRSKRSDPSWDTSTACERNGLARYQEMVSGRETSTLSMRRPSRSTTSKRQPSCSMNSPVFGMCVQVGKHIAGGGCVTALFRQRQIELGSQFVHRHGSGNQPGANGALDGVGLFALGLERTDDRFEHVVQASTSPSKWPYSS